MFRPKNPAPTPSNTPNGDSIPERSVRQRTQAIAYAQDIHAANWLSLRDIARSSREDAASRSWPPMNPRPRLGSA